MIDPHTLLHAHQTVRHELLAMRDGQGVWRGRLASSPLATATAVSALAEFCRHRPDDPRTAGCRYWAVRGAEWLLRHQNADGGWGDTDRSRSNLSTSLLAVAALRMAGMAEKAAASLARAEQYIDRQGGAGAVPRRYGTDRTFAVPILMNCALAGMVEWSRVGSLPFELACVPHRWWRLLRLPVVSYALPALVAVGQACHYQRRSLNPFIRVVRELCRAPSLRVIEPMQPPDGGFLEAIPLTAFVVMALCSIGEGDHTIVRRGLKFLLDAFRDDGSCPIDIDLAVWNTTLAVGALAKAAGEVGALGCLEWLLACQHSVEHPFTHAAPGGWAWTDLPGGVPDVDDTSGALLALRAFRDSAPPGHKGRIDHAARDGIEWLLNLQNRDGGWPTFCRGWGRLPFDRSASDLTAHAIRALVCWRDVGLKCGGKVSQTQSGSIRPSPSTVFSTTPSGFAARLDMAIARGLAFLDRTQQPDGSWTPLWFGNENEPNEENRVYGTARVLLALVATGRGESVQAKRGLDWLIAHQSADGGWGGDREATPRPSSVEETAVALEALLALGADQPHSLAVQSGLQWLIGAVETGQFRRASPIGLYFAKLWYYEDLYPVVFSLGALGEALRRYFLTHGTERKEV